MASVSWSGRSPLRKATRDAGGPGFHAPRLLSRLDRLFDFHELERLVTLDLVVHPQPPQEPLRLTLNELELLNLHAKRIRAKQPVPPAGEPSGAEGGGVLLDAGHEEPEQGELLEE